MEELQFRSLSINEVRAVLDYAQKATDNKRFMLCQFEKYFSDMSSGTTLWYGCFKDSQCMSLAVLKKYRNDGVILLAEVQSIVKGYGKPLISDILSRAKNIWWCADPVNGNEDLVRYYQQFNVKQHLIKMSKWTDTPEYVFYKADEKHEKIILDMLNKADKTCKEYDPNIL